MEMPKSIEAEQAVLGAVMVDNSLWFDVVERVQAVHFFSLDHQEIYKAMSGLAIQRKPVDVITLSEHLEALGSDIGFSYLGELAQNMPSVANALVYADIVREQAVKREILKAINRISDAVFKPEGKSVLEVASFAESAIAEAVKGSDSGETRAASANDAIRDMVQHMEKVQNSQGLVGMSTGITDCDNRTMGVQKGDLYVIGADPSMGKTARMLDFVRANIDKPNLVFSLEMTKMQLMQRLVAARGSVNYGHIRAVKPLSKEPDGWDSFNAQVVQLRKKPLYIDDQGGLSFDQIASRARRFRRENGDIGLVCVDYLQLIQLPSSDVAFETSKIITGFKALAKELECGVVILSQLNRAKAQRSDKRPQMSDLRNSGEIEAAADAICMIYRPEVYDSENPELRGQAELIWRKVRAGEIGTDHVLFQGEYQRFVDSASNYD